MPSLRAFLLLQQDPVHEVLHSVCGTIVNASVYRELVVCLISRQIPSCFFCQIFAAKFPLFPVRQPAEPNTKLICVFPQESEAKARYPVSQCGNVVAVAGKMYIVSVRGLCSSKILCRRRPFVRFAKKIVNSSMYTESLFFAL